MAAPLRSLPINPSGILVVTWQGLVTYDVLVVRELATRRVQVAGITPHPTAACMQQCARQLTDPLEGFLLGKRSLIHDRDTKFTLVLCQTSNLGCP